MDGRPDAGNLRVGDAERDAALAALGEHFAQGRLTRAEYDERAEAVWTARTGDDLALLFHDLPQPRFRIEAPLRAARWGGPTGRAHWPFPLVPLVVGLIVLTAVTHLPFVLLAVFGCLLLARGRAWR